MKESFDNIIREKLSGFEKTPPQDLKAAVFASNLIQGAGSSYSYVYVISVLSLLLFSFYPAGQEIKFGLIKPNMTNAFKKPSAYYANVQTLLNSDYEQTKIEGINNPKSGFSTIDISSASSSSATKASLITKTNNTKSFTLNTSNNYFSKPTYEEGVTFRYHLSAMKSLGMDYNEYEPYATSIELIIDLKDEKSVISKLNKKQSSFSPYLNIGTFLNYNRVTPQLEDEVYIDKYESPLSFSPARLGLNLEVGIHKQWTEKLASRFGLSFNNFNQSYSFYVRSTKPDYLELNTSNNLFEPVFEEERIEINRRVSMLGIKGQMLWQIFPNINDILFTSFEFQHLMGKTPQFDYNDVNYKLLQSSQYLVELGFRKIIIKRNIGSLYLMPSLRYSLNKSSTSEILSVKPFSAGLTLSYSFR